jgi:hypothetical protein
VSPARSALEAIRGFFPLLRHVRQGRAYMIGSDMTPGGWLAPVGRGVRVASSSLATLVGVLAAARVPARHPQPGRPDRSARPPGR